MLPASTCVCTWTYVVCVVPPSAATAAAAAAAQNIALQQQQQQQQQQAASSASLALSQQIITNPQGQIVAIGAAQVTSSSVNCIQCFAADCLAVIDVKLLQQSPAVSLQMFELRFTLFSVPNPVP